MEQVQNMLLDRNQIKGPCTDAVRNTWLAAPDSFPDFLTEISAEDKGRNEQYIQTVSDRFQKQVKSFPVNPAGRGKWKKKMAGLLEDTLCEETIIGVHRAMDRQAISVFTEELKDFLRHERAFAPELQIEDIGQAIRNYIVYAMFVEIHRAAPCFNPACFGYSMLYPITDNYIDSRDYSDEEKTEYNRLIRDRIEGREVRPASPHQQKTCELLSAIESEYPRDKDDSVYMLLLMMLDAQAESLRQQDSDAVLTAAERLDISIFKGGTSVLIDRFFVKKEMTEEDLLYYFAFGLFLQLADDLQDIAEDGAKGHQTIFTIDTDNRQEEKIVNKLLHFVHRISSDYQTDNEVFKDFVLSNCYRLVFSSVVRSREFFSETYLDTIERYLSVSGSFLRKIGRNQIENADVRTQEKYLKILDEMIS